MQTYPFPLNAEKITSRCVVQAQTVKVEVVAETGSTNADLLQRLAELEQPTLLIAEKQTAGRGRAGRSWLSAPGSSLTFSLAWPFVGAPQTLLGLPLAVGVALAEALASVNVAVQLKWPNDVLKEGKKLAGVLIESAVVQPAISAIIKHQRTWAVIGIGLNLHMPEELERQIGRPVADATWLAQMDRNQLMAILMTHLCSCLKQFSQSGLPPFIAPWNKLHAYANQHVDLVDQNKIILKGIALGVDLSGCLMLQDEHGKIWPVMAGDVSLRPSASSDDRVA